MKPKLLVVELHHLGDAVMSLPFVRGAARRFDVHVLGRPASGAVYGMLAEPPVFHTWEPPWAEGRSCGPLQAIGAALERGREMRACRFSAAAGVWADARAGLVIGGSGAELRVGFPMRAANYYAADAPWRRRRLFAGRLIEVVWRILRGGRPVYTRPLRRMHPRQHHLEDWGQLAVALGVECDYSVPWVGVPRGSAGAGTKPRLVVHAAARLPGKQWPTDRWRELLSHDAVRGRFDVVEIVPPGGEALGVEVAGVERPADVAGLAAVLASADAVVCHDSLPGHLAAALGKPVVTVFGSGEPDWFAPWRNRERAVLHRVCPLHPCIDRCGMDRYVCVEAVQVSDILRQMENLSLPE